MYPPQWVIALPGYTHSPMCVAVRKNVYFDDRLSSTSEGVHIPYSLGDIDHLLMRGNGPAYSGCSS